MDKDIRESIALLKRQLVKLENEIDQSDHNPAEDLDALSHHLKAHITYLNLLLQQESIPHVGTPQFEKWKQKNSDLVGALFPWDQVDNEILSIVNPLIAPFITLANIAKTDAKSALVVANKLESTLEDKLRSVIKELLNEKESLESLLKFFIENAVQNTLKLAGNVPGSIPSLEEEFKQAKDAIRSNIQEEFENPNSPLHNLLNLLELAHILVTLGQDLVERIEIVIHSVKDLVEDTQHPVIELLESVKKLIKAVEGNEKQEIQKELIDLLVTIIVTINPIAAAIEAMFVGKNKSLRQLLMPGIPQTGILYKWMTKVSDTDNYTDKRVERELGFRRMVVGAVDSYIRTGHTGNKPGQPTNSANGQTSPTNGAYEPGGTLRAVDLRPLVASGVEFASVISGTLLSYLFIPSGVPNPAVPKLPHLSLSMPHPFDFRADMAASVARTVTQPVMSIAAVVLNGFWVVSPNNRALVNAISGYLGNLLRSLFEHLLSGILHMVEVHEVYPARQEAMEGYLKVAVWDSWNTTPDHKDTLKFGIYLDLHTAFQMLDKSVVKNEKEVVQKALNEIVESLKKLINGVKKEEDSIFLGLLKDYVAYREAVMDYRSPRADSKSTEIEKFSSVLGPDKHKVQLEVTLDSKTLAGPTVPVVRVFGGDLAPVILMPDSNNIYTGEMNVPPLSRLTGHLKVFAQTNYGGVKSAEVSDL